MKLAYSAASPYVRKVNACAIKRGIDKQIERLKIGTTDEELKAAIATLTDEGVEIVGASDHGVTHSLYIKDPDGNELELYIDVQPETWRGDPTSVDMVTRPLVLR
mgnify:CR=1 FL=1